MKLLTSKGASWMAIVLAVVMFLAGDQAHDLLLPLLGDARATALVNVAKLLSGLLGAAGASVVATKTPPPQA